MRNIFVICLSFCRFTITVNSFIPTEIQYNTSKIGSLNTVLAVVYFWQFKIYFVTNRQKGVESSVNFSQLQEYTLQSSYCSDNLVVPEYVAGQCRFPINGWHTNDVANVMSPAF